MKCKQREVKNPKSSYQQPTERQTYKPDQASLVPSELVQNDTLMPARLAPQQRLVEQAEAELLRLYLHCLEQRLTMVVFNRPLA